MRIVFLGSGAFAIPSFEALFTAGHEVAALVTQPDREKGRGRALAPPPLKPAAESRGVTVLQPRRIREPDAQDALRRLEPELLVVVAYGQILPPAVLGLAPRGAVNVHASLLPSYRGAAPIQWAIVRGERETGVTTMLLDEGLDTGPILAARATPIGPDETAPALEKRLAGVGAELLVDTLAGLADGSLYPVAQDHERATLAPIIRKEDGRLDWSSSAIDLHRRIRGFAAWPGTSTTFAGQALKVLSAVPTDDGPGTPGTLLTVTPEGIVVACGHGTRLRVTEVQPESRRAMPAMAFAAGARLQPGSRFV